MTSIFTPTNPIFKAAFEGRIDAIHNYLAEGGGINAQDQYNNTALHWAAKGNQMKTVEYLVNRGIDCSIRNNQGDTALHWSVMSNNVFLVVTFHLGNINTVSCDATNGCQCLE